MADLIEYRAIGEADKATVMKFYEDCFLTDEPLSALSTHAPDHEGLNAFTDQVVADTIQSRFSIMATESQTDAIISVGFNIPSSVTDPNFYTIPDKYQDDAANQERKCLNMYRDIHNGINVFEMFGVDRAMHIYGLAVRGDYRRRGIASEIISKSIEAAKAQGVHMAFAEVTSNHSRKLFEKLGFQTLNEITFEDYFEEKLDTGEHKSLSLHVKLF